MVVPQPQNGSRTSQRHPAAPEDFLWIKNQRREGGRQAWRRMFLEPRPRVCYWFPVNEHRFEPS
jgi:hypothetical protein